MWQKDTDFVDMLNVVRVGKPEENSEVDKMLKARELKVQEHDDNYTFDVLHVYAQNLHCGQWNEKMLNRLDGRLHICRAEDRFQDVKLDMSKFDLSKLSKLNLGI